MIEVSRNAIFISHANPEDNAFTIWLGSRLAAAGYEVWADLFRLRGGQDWQRRLEDALRNKACKMLLVGTEHSVQKQGVRNEIQIAYNVGRKIKDSEFIIPLRLADFDAPFLIAHAQYIDFKKSWPDGFAELLETLEQTYGVPKNHDSAAKMTEHWKQVHLRNAQTLRAEPELLVSNWLSIEQLPETIYIYEFYKGFSIEPVKRQTNPVSWPIVPLRGGFLAFCPLDDLKNQFGPDIPLRVTDKVMTEHFLEDGWPEQDIEKYDARNQFCNLVRQAMELTFKRHSLTSYKMANEQLAWWGKRHVVPSGQIRFFWENELTGRRQIMGFSRIRNLYWHYGVTPQPRVFPIPHVRLVSRIIFTEDGFKPIENPKQMHRFRRSFTKSWRNAKWRDMMLAFLYWLSDGETVLEVALGTEVVLTLALPPMTFSAPMSIVLQDDEEEEFETEDDLAKDDENAFDLDSLDGDEEPLEADDEDNQHRGGELENNNHED